MSLFQSNDLLGKNIILPISYDDFKQGYTLFQWNLSDNRKVVNAGPNQRGNVKVVIEFEDMLPEAMTLVFYGIFDSTVYIYGNDMVLVNGI